MDTATQILDAALAEFYRNGFHASGVDQLSSRAGVTKRTLYRHFPSKECLIDAVLQQRDEQFMEALQTFVEARAMAERPAAYLDFLENWGQSDDFHGCMFINAAAEYGDHAQAPHRAAKAHKLRVRAFLEKICREAGLPEALAGQLFLLGEGLIVSMQVLGDAASASDAARAALGALCAAAPAPKA